MSFAKNMKDTAKRLIAKYGNSITLVEVIDGIYNPATGEHTTTETLYPVKGVMGRYTTAEYSSDHVQIGDVKLTVETDLIITRDWKVDYDKERFTVLDTTIISSQDTKIIYILQLRK